MSCWVTLKAGERDFASELIAKRDNKDPMNIIESSLASHSQACRQQLLKSNRLWHFLLHFSPNSHFYYAQEKLDQHPVNSPSDMRKFLLATWKFTQGGVFFVMGRVVVKFHPSKARVVGST